jgi:hypothetical protein
MGGMKLDGIETSLLGPQGRPMKGLLYGFDLIEGHGPRWCCPEEFPYHIRGRKQRFRGLQYPGPTASVGELGSNAAALSVNLIG